MSSQDDRIKELESQIELLHQSLETKGTNSRRTQGLNGRVFQVPVDAEHKATQLPITKCGVPHMRAFHASWFGFFSTFFSTFAPAPLAPVLKRKTTLGLTRNDLATGNILSVTSNIVCRFLMGIVCDKMGARRGLAFLMFITAPFILGIALVQNAAGFIACRFFIGMGLASFVACQVWCTQQFSKKVVGAANATAGGWGNLGGGVTTLLMGQIFLAFMAATNENENLSWRLCMAVPFALHIAAGIFALTGTDLPDGNYAELEQQGSKQKSKSDVVVKVGLSNVNAWILTFTYGFCFGVELTVTNVATQFFYEYFALTQVNAGTLASIFGLVNIVARSLGGLCSDCECRRGPKRARAHARPSLLLLSKLLLLLCFACPPPHTTDANKLFGMRGRIWALFIWQMAEGAICLIMGTLTLKYTAPDLLGAQDVIGWTQISGWAQPQGTGSWVQTGSTVPSWVAFDGPCITERISHCSAEQIVITDAMRACLDPRFAGLKSVVLSEPPAPWGNGGDCVSNSGLLPTIVLLLFIFSLCVQMSEGLSYGVVPFISRPALGVVSGMVGAGGNAGALITNILFFSSDSMRTDQGMVYMGISILAVTSLLVFVYFPQVTTARLASCLTPDALTLTPTPLPNPSLQPLTQY